MLPYSDWTSFVGLVRILVVKLGGFTCNMQISFHFPLLKHPAWHLGILRNLKHATGKRNVWNTWIGIWDLTVGSRNLSNSSRRRDQVSNWICVIFISRGDYWNKEWNQYSMNEFINPLMNRFDCNKYVKMLSLTDQKVCPSSNGMMCSTASLKLRISLNCWVKIGWTNNNKNQSQAPPRVISMGVLHLFFRAHGDTSSGPLKCDCFLSLMEKLLQVVLFYFKNTKIQ